MLENLQYISSSAWLSIVGLALLLFAVVWLLRRRHSISSPSEAGAAPRVGRGLIYVLKLAGFALLSFVIIGGGLMVSEVYRGVGEDLTPAPSRVEVPADLPFEVQEVTFAGGDGLTMAGWFVPPQNGATIMLLHGYGGNRLAMRWHAEVLVEAGYGVLMYDERASGESEGTHRSYGWEDPADVGGALAYLDARSEGEPGAVGIAGCSIGGQIALQGAAYYPEIDAVWADGPSIVKAVDLPPVNNWATAIEWLSSRLFDFFYRQRLDVDPQPMIDIIGDIAPRPMVLVGGGTPHPHFGSEARQIERYAEYAGENAAVWIIPDAYHCDGPIHHPQEYAERMVQFFDTAFACHREEDGK